jgi:hypothetical protein
MFQPAINNQGYESKLMSVFEVRYIMAVKLLIEKDV